MANIEIITQELVKEIFDYKDGFLLWKNPKCDKVKIGDKAGYINRKYRDRRIVGLNYKRYFSYRLIFLWHHGYLPKCVDHINHDTLDDRIENLRAATKKQNSRNRNSNIGSISKYLGVTFHKKRKKWQAQIGIGNDTCKYIGCFDNEEEAALAYNEKAAFYFGEFANLNVISI